MSTSPYAGRQESQWARITNRLVAHHPLKLPTIVSVAVSAWETLWKTTVGAGKTAVRLYDLRVPATIVGYFFEILFAKELQRRSPELWRGGASKDEKDVVCLKDASLCIEIKTSGQCGFKVYGNRSYGQRSKNDLLLKKEKSGYYITANFFERSLTLLRFGWIDAEDWDPQEAPTGQMAGLKPSVYRHKLIGIPGAYRREAPVIVLDGVGPKADEEFRNARIRTVGDLLKNRDKLPGRLARLAENNRQFLDACSDESIDK
jgi:hypothetical protein